MTSFHSMTRAEATVRLESFLATAPDRLQDAARALKIPAGLVLDYSVESLEAFWTASLDALAVERLSDDHDRPASIDPQVPVFKGLTVGQALVVDAVGTYFGQCLVAAVEESHWAVGGAGRPKSYAYRNHPVVAGLPSDECPPLWITAVALKKAAGPGDASGLVRLFAWWATGPTTPLP